VSDVVLAGAGLAEGVALSFRAKAVFDIQRAACAGPHLTCVHFPALHVSLLPEHGLTVTYTSAFDQQHWNRPPSPDQSFATACSTYSPGSLNVAAVTAFPWNLVAGGAEKSAVSTAGVSFAKVMEPGPRNLLHLIVTAGVFGCIGPGIMLASSTAHSAKVIGFGNFVVSDPL
jgi:hypothetical protein